MHILESSLNTSGFWRKNIPIKPNSHVTNMSSEASYCLLAIRSRRLRRRTYLRGLLAASALRAQWLASLAGNVLTFFFKHGSLRSQKNLIRLQFSFLQSGFHGPNGLCHCRLNDLSRAASMASMASAASMASTTSMASTGFNWPLFLLCKGFKIQSWKLKSRIKVAFFLESLRTKLCKGWSA